jgi:D-methionine transport system ATP-binding protein
MNSRSLSIEFGAVDPGNAAGAAARSGVAAVTRGNIVAIEHLSKRFDGANGAIHALRDIDLEIRSGEIFGIIGRSGAGKSTLIRCINLLERPSSGRVRVDGLDLSALAPAELRAARRRIGMIFQHFNLLSSRTVYGNVAFPLELAGTPKAEVERRVRPLLDLVGLADLADRYPAQVSGGQKQRIGIARALASEPSVLLSDEATSALDPETTRAILSLLEDINRKLGLTIVLITHQMQVVQQICDRVAVMEAGAVVEVGNTLDVFARPATDTTRSLLQDVLRQAVPAEAIRHARSHLASGAGRLWRVNINGGNAGRPLLSSLVRDFGLDVNLLQGHIDEIRGTPFGSLLILVSGPARELDGALVHLRAHGAAIEEIDHVE